MKTFRITENIEIVCEWKKTRTAFKHVATLLINGVEEESTKICYLNRTWERYEFQSVMEKLIGMSKILSDDDKKICKAFIENYKEGLSDFKTVAMIMKIGELFTKDQKGANDWKLRMLKAGMENKGLIMPEDWNSLSEEEKEKRLNNVIGVLK